METCLLEGERTDERIAVDAGCGRGADFVDLGSL